MSFRQEGVISGGRGCFRRLATFRQEGVISVDRFISERLFHEGVMSGGRRYFRRSVLDMLVEVRFLQCTWLYGCWKTSLRFACAMLPIESRALRQRR